MLSLLYCLSGHRESESSPCSPSFIVCQDTGRVSPHRALPPLSGHEVHEHSPGKRWQPSHGMTIEHVRCSLSSRCCTCTVKKLFRAGPVSYACIYGSGPKFSDQVRHLGIKGTAQQSNCMIAFTMANRLSSYKVEFKVQAVDWLRSHGQNVWADTTSLL